MRHACGALIIAIHVNYSITMQPKTNSVYYMHVYVYMYVHTDMRNGLFILS